jgi:hypothetical protein
VGALNLYAGGHELIGELAQPVQTENCRMVACLSLLLSDIADVSF